MKTILRSIIFYSIALYVTSQIFGGITISGGIETLFISGAIFAALSLILKPILKIIALPLTILTFGLFAFIINGIILFILTKIEPHIQIHAFTIQKLTLGSIRFPSLNVNIIFAFIVLSAIISFLVGFLSWLT